MEEVDQIAPVTDPTLTCCLCSNLPQEAVLLTCLHNSCRLCFSKAATNGIIEGVACGFCDAVTPAGKEQPNHFMDYRVQRHMSAAALSRMCDVCRQNSKPDEPAVEWCTDCRQSFCEDCKADHGEYEAQHVTHSLEELRRMQEMSSQPSVSTCEIHKFPVTLACRTCQKAKCSDCCAECLKEKHAICGIDTDLFESYLGSIIGSISSLESTLLLKSKALEIPKDMLLNRKEARNRHLMKIKERKCRIIRAVEKAFEEIELSTKSAYDVVEEEDRDAVAAADRIALTMSDARTYIRLLVESNDKCEIINQEKSVRERLTVLSAAVDALDKKPRRAVNINAVPLLEDLENIIREWIGLPEICSASSFGAASVFGAASASLQLPVSCQDVTLTKDGRRLLAAAGRRGLIELSCSSGRELSRWQPPEYSSGMANSVLAVAALSEGRAAVSLSYARLVVILRRIDKKGSDVAVAAGAGDAAWTEERRFDQLLWEPGGLSAHGDLLAAAEWLGTGRLQLLSLSSSRQLTSERQRDYTISSLAVAARVVVTVSFEKVGGGGRRPPAQVLDAHSLTDDDERVWRVEMEEEEELYGVCAESTGGCLYASVQRRDGCSGKVCVLSALDGSTLLRVALSFNSAATAPQLLPGRLSLSDDGAAAEQREQECSRSRGRSLQLAVLCRDSDSGECRTVTLHSSSDS